jgi:hypothetical protein
MCKNQDSGLDPEVQYRAFCLPTETGRLPVNPFAKAAKGEEGVDPRRQRRALTENELRLAKGQTS